MMPANLRTISVLQASVLQAVMKAYVVLPQLRFHKQQRVIADT